MPKSRKPVVVVTRKLPDVVETRMCELFDTRLNLNDRRMSHSDLMEAVKMADVLVPTVTDRIDSAILGQAGENLRLIANFGTGVDNIDVATALQHGITVTNTPGVLTEDTADMTMALILAVPRRLAEGAKVLTGDTEWEGWSPTWMLGHRIWGKRLGIVGMGRIGRAIGRRLEAFGVPVVYHSRNPQTDIAYKYYPDLVAMARDVDTLIVIVPGGSATRNLINAEVLAALGPRGILINMARGSVVDEPALIKALQTKTILSAGLDVFANEPHVPAELLAMDHIVLLPHLGTASEYTRSAMDQLVVDNLLAWFSGKPPLTPVPETPYPPQKPR